MTTYETTERMIKNHLTHTEHRRALATAYKQLSPSMQQIIARQRQILAEAIDGIGQSTATMIIAAIGRCINATTDRI